jgi:hypothetical protein
MIIWGAGEKFTPFVTVYTLLCGNSIDRDLAQARRPGDCSCHSVRLANATLPPLAGCVRVRRADVPPLPWHAPYSIVKAALTCPMAPSKSKASSRAPSSRDRRGLPLGRATLGYAWPPARPLWGTTGP